MTPYSFFRNIYLPYCLQRQKNGEYIIQNRQYNPVGFSSGRGIDYEKISVSVPLKITKATAKKLSWEESDNLDRIYLYIEYDAPDTSKKNMDAYLVKLQLLMKLKIRT